MYSLDYLVPINSAERNRKFFNYLYFNKDRWTSIKGEVIFKLKVVIIKSKKVYSALKNRLFYFDILQLREETLVNLSYLLRDVLILMRSTLTNLQASKCVCMCVMVHTCRRNPFKRVIGEVIFGKYLLRPRAQNSDQPDQPELHHQVIHRTLVLYINYNRDHCSSRRSSANINACDIANYPRVNIGRSNGFVRRETHAATHMRKLHKCLITRN